ncbi:hypothetical protein, partial [Planktothrix sp. FACHB-1355]|uniref:hypothetical protein n=1 Tax=Planktothrix sp. FACHB-1355 TaxID=2692854 RepID=UPI001A7EFC8E
VKQTILNIRSKLSVANIFLFDITLAKEQNNNNWDCVESHSKILNCPVAPSFSEIKTRRSPLVIPSPPSASSKRCA